MVVAGAALALTTLLGCDRSPKPRDEAAIAAAVDKARAEEEEADRRLRERAIAEELARRDAEQAEIDQRTRREQDNEATIARLEERLRAVLVDPASMQVRNAGSRATAPRCAPSSTPRTSREPTSGFAAQS